MFALAILSTSSPRDNAVGSRAAMTDTIVSLCKAYKDWQSEHGLYLGGVPEIPVHIKDGHLTTNEREWLRAFIQHWNAACDRERASAVAA